MKPLIVAHAFIATYGAAMIDRPWAKNIGGIGTPEDQIKFVLIDEQSIDNVKDYKMYI